MGSQTVLPSFGEALPADVRFASLSWWLDLERRALVLKPEGHGVPGKVSVVVVYGHKHSGDLSGLVGEDMIWVTCKGTTRIRKVGNNCERLYKENGSLKPDEDLILFYKHNSNPIPPSATVQELDATAEVIVVLAEAVKKGATVKTEGPGGFSTIHSTLPAAPGPSFSSIASQSPRALDQALPSPTIKSDPFSMTPDTPAIASIPAYNGEACRSWAKEATLLVGQSGSDIKVKGEHASQEPLVEVAKAPPKQIRTIQLAALFKETSLDDLEGGVKEGIEIIKKLQQVVAPEPAAVQGDLKMWYQQLTNLKSQGSCHKTIIGVVGNTGAGKSSVINALLDEERLVPTNCMRACTAVVTEISFNYETEDPYRAAIEFIEVNDWERELRTLFGDLRDGGDMRSKDSEAGVALAKIKAVYPNITKDEILGTTPEALLAKSDKISAVLGTTREIHETNSLRFYKKLQKYVDSNEKTEKAIPGEKKPPKEMEYWPLIKVVKLYVKSNVLSTGAVVVDLPGTHDANAARAGVAEGYMKNCTGLWIVAPITRAVDDKTAHTLLGQTFRRQLLMDGGFASVSFICSKSDDISITEATLSLKLEEELEAENAELERLEEKMEELKNQKGQLAEGKKVYNSVIDDLTEQLETWDVLKDKVEEGEEVFEPKPAAKKEPEGSKKRKRGAGSKGKGKCKKTKADDDEMNDFIVVTEDDDSEIEEVNSDSEKENSQSLSHALGPPLTEGDIKNRIVELKERKKKTRQDLRDLTNQMSDVQDQFADVKAQHTKLRNKVATYCIQARNNYSTTAIKQDFAAGLQELDMEAAEKEDAVNFDPTKQVRDYEDVAKQLPVFCVSSRGYQKLCGRLKRDGDPPVFSNVEESGMPQLQSHCMKLTEKGREYGARKFINNLSLMVNSLSLWAVQTSNSGGFGVDDQMFHCLEQVLDDVVSDTANNMKGVLKDSLYGRFSLGVDDAAEQAVPTSQSWARPLYEGGMHWSTYKAVCRHNGCYSSMARGPLDFNSNLSDPLIKVIAADWERTFTRFLPPVVHGYLQHCVTGIEKFHLQIQDQARQTGKGLMQLGILERQLGMYEQQARMASEEAINQINTIQRDTNREFAPVVMNAMLPSYIWCVEERGPGSYMRMKTHMIEHVTENRRAMFEASTTRVRQLLEAMVRTVQRCLEESTDTIFQTVRRDYKLIGDNSGLGQQPKFLEEKKAMRNVLGRVENDFRELIGLERLEELDGLDELPQLEEEDLDPEEMERMVRQLGPLPSDPHPSYHRYDPPGMDYGGIYREAIYGDDDGQLDLDNPDNEDEEDT
ncbi:hypothetical protein BGX38DRAFT_1273714 [Terfezia claveryi]|nr:hypothetical protein BGX38DRAFT_1273714 [Terfezia claveryi]